MGNNFDKNIHIFDYYAFHKRVLECIFISATFFKCLDNILQQIDFYLAISRKEKCCEVRNIISNFVFIIKPKTQINTTRRTLVFTSILKCISGLFITTGNYFTDQYKQTHRIMYKYPAIFPRY